MKAPCNVKVYIINLQEARKTSSRTVMREENDIPPPNNRVNVTQSKLILTCLYFWDFTISLLFSSLCYLCFQMKPDYVYTESKIKIEVTYELQAFQFRAPGVFHPPLSTLQFGNASCCLLRNETQGRFLRFDLQSKHKIHGCSCEKTYGAQVISWFPFPSSLTLLL